MVRILVVEDEPAISNLVSMALTGAGYQCFTAGDGLTAADLLERESFDLALLDIMLPGCDGFELLAWRCGSFRKQSRSHPPLRRLPPHSPSRPRRPHPLPPSRRSRPGT